MYLKYLILVVLVPLSITYQIYVPPKIDTIEGFDTYSPPKIGPRGVSYNQSTSCQTFAKYARFNPHSVLDTQWFAFYYWSPLHTTTVYEFTIPTKQELVFLHEQLDGHLPNHFNWSSTLVLMSNVQIRQTTLLEQKNDRGRYLSYTIPRGLPEGKITSFKDIRLRQTGDNKYLGLMFCKARTVFIMSRIDQVPPKKKIQDEAAKLGFRGRGGKSYLYQGHEWMPIPEMEEYEFWVHKDNFTKGMNTTRDKDTNGTKNTTQFKDANMTQNNDVFNDKDVEIDKEVTQDNNLDYTLQMSTTQGKKIEQNSDMIQLDDLKQYKDITINKIMVRETDIKKNIEDKGMTQSKDMVPVKSQTQNKDTEMDEHIN